MLINFDRKTGLIKDLLGINPAHALQDCGHQGQSSCERWIPRE